MLQENLHWEFIESTTLKLVEEISSFRRGWSSPGCSHQITTSQTGKRKISVHTTKPNRRQCYAKLKSGYKNFSTRYFGEETSSSNQVLFVVGLPFLGGRVVVNACTEIHSPFIWPTSNCQGQYCHSSPCPASPLQAYLEDHLVTDSLRRLLGGTVALWVSYPQDT